MITVDPDVTIVAQGPTVTHYRASNGREWMVRGLCDQRGWCVIGATVYGWRVRDVHDYRQLRDLLGDRLGFRLDCPVTSSFKGCCPFRIREL